MSSSNTWLQAVECMSIGFWLNLWLRFHSFLSVPCWATCRVSFLDSNLCQDFAWLYVSPDCCVSSLQFSGKCKQQVCLVLQDLQSFYNLCIVVDDKRKIFFEEPRKPGVLSYDGVPFTIQSSTVLECHHGRDRHLAQKKRRKEVQVRLSRETWGLWVLFVEVTWQVVSDWLN